MKQTEIIIPEKFVSTMNINGMRGRVMNLPHKKNYKRKKSPEILMIYGHHTSLERMYSTSMAVSSYGNITMPDLPGFGGMDSFYSINKTPTLENMADYLATFVKLHYKRKRFNIIGMSYGFLVVTKMLQKYPEIAGQTNLVFSFVGFSKKEDFTLSKKFYYSLLYGSRIAKTRFVNYMLRAFIFTKPVIKMSYSLNADSHAKLKDANKQERARRINFEIYLWKINDLRTYFFTTDEFLRVNLTKNKINLILHHVCVKQDQYFDNKIVTANLRKIYKKVYVHFADLPNHAPTVISDEKSAAKIIAKSLKPHLGLLK